MYSRDNRVASAGQPRIPNEKQNVSTGLFSIQHSENIITQLLGSVGIQVVLFHFIMNNSHNRLFIIDRTGSFEIWVVRDVSSQQTVFNVTHNKASKQVK
jgi:hypothetical protein